MTSDFDAALELVLRSRTESHQLRARRAVRRFDRATIEIDGQRYVDFSSNDYLGFANANSPNSAEGGSGASPLVTGFSPQLQDLERAIARWKRTEAAIALPSGYQANHAAVQTLAAFTKEAGREPLFIADKLVHASLLDAVAGVGATMRTFPHNTLAKLERLLEQRDASTMAIVLTESIYSMDGDVAPLRELAALRRQLPFVWLLDEAHSSGLYGEQGCGLAHEMGVADDVDVSITTFSKALGQSGGAIAGSQRLIEAVANFGRAYIYSTAISPSAAVQLIHRISEIQLAQERRDRLADNTRHLREALTNARLLASMPSTSTPIVPIVIGDAAAALSASQRLQDAGFLVVAIRPPTVAPGSSRLRITVSSAHSHDQIDALVKALQKIISPA